MMCLTPESSMLATIDGDRTKKLPTEIADAICKELDLPVIASLRLVSRFWKEVATRYLITEIHVLFNADSFDRLRDVSEQPVISSHITSLLYEPDMLFRHRGYDVWEMTILYNDYIHKFNDYRAYWRCQRHLFNPAILAEAYERYSKLLGEQKVLHGQAFGAEKLLQAMCRMPNLTSITMVLTRSIIAPSEYAEDVYEPAIYQDFDSLAWTYQPGVVQMRSLLLGAYQAGLKLDELHLAIVDASILQEPDDNWNKFEYCLKHLTTLGLVLSEYVDEDFEGEYDSAARLLELVSAAPKLRHLTLGFHGDWPNFMYFEDVFRAATWPSLQSATLDNIDVSANNLLEFCTRHASTLRRLVLWDAGLTTGAWVDVFESMRDTLLLDCAEIRGKLLWYEAEGYWGLECYNKYYDPLVDEEPAGNDLSKAIADYLVRKADICPLREVEKYAED